MKSNGCHVVFVESNGSYGREMVRTALEQGLTVTVLAGEPERFHEQGSMGAELVRCDTRSVPAVLEAVRRLPEPGCSGVLAGYEMVLPVAATVARVLGLPGPDPVAAQDTLHKHRARALSNQLVGNPVDFWLLDTPDEVERIAGSEYPLLAKPAASGGSLGVRSVASSEELARYVAEWKNAPDERGAPLEGPVLVERLVTGGELSVELFHGVPVAVSYKELSGDTGFVESGHTVLPWTEAVERKELEPYLALLTERLGTGWGPTHVELRLDESSTPRLIEVNHRLGGDHIPLLVRLVTGFDMYTATLRAALGERVTLEIGGGGEAVIRYLMAEHEGTFREVRGLESVRAMPGVHDVVISREEGARVRPPVDSGDRVGHLIAHSAEGLGAVRTARRAMEKLLLLVERETEKSR
ncbi:ATP-grasp domain-containing protein [Actinopolyspora mortivallis]|uniref:ATP-grasp domain-containing protein n=1 Tax=Actinopolyspora mortivallis TaxID=33906 RepID=A0A2T0GSV3_ACTMO|nr:ATP-grasp domain-containing protein [Actinopolyspora mortivallis]PRW62171.1 hypothetical protein CEP50_16700 [Actinopolyspora mortivallis]